MWAAFIWSRGLSPTSSLRSPPPSSQKDQMVSSHPLKVQYLCLVLHSKFKVSVFFSVFMTIQEMPRGQSQSVIDPRS